MAVQPWKISLRKGTPVAYTLTDRMNLTAQKVSSLASGQGGYPKSNCFCCFREKRPVIIKVPKFGFNTIQDLNSRVSAKFGENLWKGTNQSHAWYTSQFRPREWLSQTSQTEKNNGQGCTKLIQGTLMFKTFKYTSSLKKHVLAWTDGRLASVISSVQ